MKRVFEFRVLGFKFPGLGKQVLSTEAHRHPALATSKWGLHVRSFMPNTVNSAVKPLCG